MRYLPKLINLLSFIALVVTFSAALTTTNASPNEQVAPAWDNTLRRIRVPILMYHYVSPLPLDADEYRIGLTVEPAAFQAHMSYLYDNGYTTISLYQLNDALMTGSQLPPKPVILTFDDGYVDHYTNVLPVLKQYGFTATFFVITGRADTGDPQYLSWGQIVDMANAGMSMESHTKTHSDLRSRSNDFLVYELLGSLQSLSTHTGSEPRMFCYPGGRYDINTINVLKTLPVWRAVTTEYGMLHTTDNYLQLPRIRISGGTSASGLAGQLNSSY